MTHADMSRAGRTDQAGPAADAAPMRLDVVTVFPDYLAPLELSLIGRARRDGLLDIRTWDLRDFTHDRHRTVDDTPYGGGAGMVMRPQPWGEALEAVIAAGTAGATPGTFAPGVAHLIVPSPAGQRFTQATARSLANERWLVFACGRYEGIDERVLDEARAHLPVSVLSLGDYVLAGGEVAALAMIEAITRLRPGVLGNAASLDEESHEDGLLEYPVYTKPVRWRGRTVPEVLTSGDHAAVDRWRRRQSIARTVARRPDLAHPALAVQIEPGVGAAEPARLDGTAHEHMISAPEYGGLRIRPTIPADAGELLVLQRCCAAPHRGGRHTDLDDAWWDQPVLLETPQEVRADIENWVGLVARSHGRLVGAVRARLQGEVWRIDRLMVAPDLQGHGLGRLLLSSMERLAPDAAYHAELFAPAWSVEGTRLYRRAGYRSMPAPIPSDGTVRLRKRLVRD